VPSVDLTVIIVSYNVKEFLEQALRSVLKATRGMIAEVFVVDNNSQDGSAELVRDRFPQVRLIINKKNLGFARANNQALRQAQGQYIALVNPDCLIQEDTFIKIIEFFKNHPEAGMVGCKVLNPDGSLQLACRRSFPTPWVAFTKLVGLGRLFPQSRWFGRYNLTYLSPEEVHEVDAVSGSFMVIRRELLREVGYLDESFFLYGEDLDWCYRIKKAGWKIYYIPNTKIIHYKGESSKKSELDSTLMFYKAMLVFVRKHFRKRYLIFPEWFLITGIGVKAALSFSVKILKRIATPLIDLISLNLSLLMALLIRFGHLAFFKSYLVVDGIYSFVWLTSLYSFDLYHRKKFSSAQTALAVLVGLVINSFLTFFFKQYAFSRAVVVIWGTLNVLFLGGWRLLIRLVQKTGKMPFLGTIGKTILRRRVLVVGTGKTSEQLIQRLRERVDGGYEVVGAIGLHSVDQGGVLSGVKILGSVDNLRWFVKNYRIQEVIFSTETIPYQKIMDIISNARDWGVTFKLAPSGLEVIIGKAFIDRIEEVPLVDIDYRLTRSPYKFLKRGMDVFIALIVSMATFLPYLYLRYFKRIPLEGREIHGEGGKTVRIFNLSSGENKWWSKIPLFWSVLLGDISLVGSEILDYHRKPERKITLKPGITGLVQVNPGLSVEEKEKYELFYMRNYSPLLDAEIIARAIFKL